KEALFQIRCGRLEGSGALVHIQEDFPSQTAGYIAVSKLSLCVGRLASFFVRLKLVRVTRQIGVVTNRSRTLRNDTRTRAGDDRLQLADLAIFEGVGRLIELIREAACERKFVQRVNPVCSLIIEFPVRMGVALLQR